MIILHRKLREDEMLFGECQSVIIVTIAEEDLHELVLIALKEDISTHTIGKVTGNSRLSINELVDIDRKELQDAYFNSLEDTLNHG